METNNKQVGEFVYHRILNMSTIKKRPWTPEEDKWKTAPVSIDDKIVATNGHILIMVPKFEHTYSEGKESLRQFISLQRNCNHTIHTALIEAAVDKTRTEDAYYNTIGDCEACDGEGDVDYNFSHNRKEYIESFECPVCGGSGTTTTVTPPPNGKKAIDYNYRIQIGNSLFAVKYIAMLLDIAELLQCETVSLVLQTGNKEASLFAIGDIEMYIMPLFPSILHDDKVIEIKW